MPQVDYITEQKDSALYDAFLRHRPTKQGHNYLPLFVRHFEPIRHDVKRVLEIGIESGASLRMWRDYFPNAEIWGFDIDPDCKSQEGDRIRVVIGDQSRLEDFSELPTDFDIVIDDGSHVQDHQIGTFQYLFPLHMAERGIYAIEDCLGRTKTINWFKALADLVNYWPEGFPGKDWPKLNSLEEADSFTCSILGVCIYRYIIFVDKGRNPQDGEAGFRLRGSEKP